MYVAIDPKSGKPKEYANSAEFFKEVEEFTAKEPEKQREVKTFADASERIRDELGLDTRSPAEQKAAADNEFIEKRIAEGVSAALEQAQKAEKAQQAQQAAQTGVASQSPFSFDITHAKAQQAQQAAQTGVASQSPFSFDITHAAQPRYKFYDGQEGCGCKASQKPAAEVIHTRRGTGPVMTARLAGQEVTRGGVTYKLYGVRPVKKI